MLFLLERFHLDHSDLIDIIDRTDKKLSKDVLKELDDAIKEIISEFFKNNQEEKEVL